MRKEKGGFGDTYEIGFMDGWSDIQGGMLGLRMGQSGFLGGVSYLD